MNAGIASATVQLPPIGPLAADADWGQYTREYLQGVTAQLRAQHHAGASGHTLVQGYTAAMDHLLRTLFDAASAAYTERYARLDQRCTVAAQGGYGRGELNPCSDIDLLFLYQNKREPYVEHVAERILYALWGTRLTVGHAMRNVRECVRLAQKDLKVKTSLLDARYLCGDEALYQEFAVAMEREVPGKTAENIWQMPIQMACPRLMASIFQV